jgi:hypothetical protein
VFSLVILSTTLDIGFLIINSGVLDMLVGTIMGSRDAMFFEDEFTMNITHDSSINEPTIPP